MSEYQYVTFRAVDGPLDDEQLEFARRQSTRAEVTRWSLSVEYHYSSFRGDVHGLLRGGYGVYLEYASYGTREIKWRLPYGIPGADSVWSEYLGIDELAWEEDAEGGGGILTLCPLREWEFSEPVWDVEKYVDAAVRCREHLIRGDLRALYVLWLCAATSDFNDREDVIEPSVPHGISEIGTVCGELLEFFAVDPFLLDAAGEGVEAAPAVESTEQACARWVKSLGRQRTQDLLLEVLTDDALSVKARLLAEIQRSRKSDTWPMTGTGRNLEQLFERADRLRSVAEARQARKAEAAARREARKAERERADRLKAMAAEPEKWLREARQLVEARGLRNYEAVAELLRDLREAIGGEDGARLARREAARLAKKYPTLNRLKGSLRRRGLLD